MDALRMEVENLNAMINELSKRVSKEKDRGLQTLPEVDEWITWAEEVETKASNLLDGSISECHILSKCDDFSEISSSTHSYNESVRMTLKEVEALRSKGVFKVLVERSPLSLVKKILPPLQKIVSREILFEKVWKCLAGNQCGTLGLYGMAGVGKSNLLTRIKKKFEEVGDVSGHMILLVVVASDEVVESIQDEIYKRCYILLGGEAKDHKAKAIWNLLRRKRFVLLLDGIQKEVDLEEIGVPRPSRENGCKIVFTTRSREACGSKWVDAVEEVTCLGPEEAWEVFEEVVGETTLKSHPDIPQMARIVARKCGGLPLALTLAGKTMSCKRTVREWHHAINVLVSSTKKNSSSEVPILKFAYDNLPGEDIRSCFMYCTLFPKIWDISKQELVDCWIGEGMVKDEDREIAEMKGYEMIGDLVIMGFLTENESGDGVKMMHDMVLEMASWIASQASDSGRHAENIVVKCGKRIISCQRSMIGEW
ncbi:unnamed protein product [Microthlaspi erraticum]|uniref:Uncharacterized protein n=1 Tax=Microthlaspi erraticum TaxID=1685480 RepID=A0A6D2IFE2_9BRAS|nr:unnamed protein product [Microthlaspi erraticum]